MPTVGQECRQMDRAPTGVGVDHHAGRHRRGETQVVGGGHAVDEHATLVPSSERVDDLAIACDRRLLRQAIESRQRQQRLYAKTGQTTGDGGRSEPQDVDGACTLTSLRGNRARKTLPAGPLDHNNNCPPCASAIHLAIGRPKPAPAYSELNRTNR